MSQPIRFLRPFYVANHVTTGVVNIVATWSHNIFPIGNISLGRANVVNKYTEYKIKTIQVSASHRFEAYKSGRHEVNSIAYVMEAFNRHKVPSRKEETMQRET